MNISDSIAVEPGSAAVAQPAQHRRGRLLLADDDPAVRDSLALVLESEGYEVVQARDGKEAVLQFQEYHPDLVLLDLNMPRQNGWSAFEAMEALRPLVPCIIITAKSNQQDCAQGHGIDVLMEKPLDMDQMLNAIRALLEEPRQQHISRVTSSDFRTWCIPGTGHRRRR